VEAIPALAQLLDESELVRGVRLSGRKHIPALNRIGNLLFDGVLRLVHTVEGGDVLSGMYGGRRDCLLALCLESEGFDIEAEISVKGQALGFKCATLPITYGSREGAKKLNAFRDGLRILYRVLQLAATLSPLMIFILPGLTLLGAGLTGVTIMLFEPLMAVDLPFAANGTFLFGVMGSLGAQLVIFGLAVYAAGMAYGLRGRANKTLDRASQYLCTHASMVTGLVLGSVGLAGIVWVALDWMVHSGGPLVGTGALVLWSLATMLGFQLLSSAIFLSALKGLRRKTPYGAE
jgi:hypothetical protein